MRQQLSSLLRRLNPTAAACAKCRGFCPRFMTNAVCAGMQTAPARRSPKRMHYRNDGGRGRVREQPHLAARRHPAPTCDAAGPRPAARAARRRQCPTPPGWPNAPSGRCCRGRWWRTRSSRCHPDCAGQATAFSWEYDGAESFVALAQSRQRPPKVATAMLGPFKRWRDMASTSLDFR